MGIDMANISEQFLQGAQIHDCLEDIAQLRLAIFKEYPYLYDGRLQDELEYLRHYAAHGEAIAIIAFCANNIAGAVTAIPLHCESNDMTAPFAATSYPVERVYYIGELLFYQDYRNQGLGTRLLSRIEQHVRKQMSYDYLASATVVRPDNDPLCPEGYVPIKRFLDRNRFVKLPGVTTHFTWKETDGMRRGHEMQLWIKDLAG